MWTKNFQMLRLDLENAEEPEIEWPTSIGSLKKQENSRKTSTSALLIIPKLLTMFSSVAHSCPTLCDPMDCTMLGFPVHHQFPELAQTHVHQVGDAIQPSHPLSAPSPPAFNLSQHHDLFQWVSFSHQVAKVLELQLQLQSWIFRTDFLQDWLVGSPCCPRDFQESSPTPQFKSINSSAPSFLYGPTFIHICTWLLAKP